MSPTVEGRAPPPPAACRAAWHRAECGSYTADLGEWRRLGRAADGPVLELGSGTGRVSLELSAAGHDPTALDSDPGLLGELGGRLRAVAADARCMSLDRRFGLILAPMQLLQLLLGRPERAACLRGIAGHLLPGGRFAAAILASGPDGRPSGDAGGEGEWRPPPEELPSADTAPLGTGLRAVSQPLAWGTRSGILEVERLRTVEPAEAGPASGAPDGPAGSGPESGFRADDELPAELHTTRLALLTAAQLEREAEAASLELLERRPVPATDLHVGSTILVWRRRGRP